MSEEFKPTDIVLAKVKGYPPWPAMVLEESILPDYVVAKKPKTTVFPAKKTKGKQAAPAYIVPVRFFSDDTYIWIKSNDIKRLDAAMIDAHFGAVKRRKDNLLDSAYELANDPLDMQLFVKYGSRGRSPSPPPSPEVKSPEPKKRKTAPKKVEKKTEKKVQKKLELKKEAKKPVKKVEPKQEEEEDSDWGLAEDLDENYKQGNYIYDNKKDQIEFMQNFPSSMELSTEHNIQSQEFHKLSTSLIQSLRDLVDFQSSGEASASLTPQTTVDDIVSQLRALKSKNLPKTIVLKSKLLKWLVLVNRKVDHKKVNDKINDLLQVWVDYTIDVNPEIEEPAELEGAKSEDPQELSGTDNDKQTSTNEHNGTGAPENGVNGH